MIRLVHVALIVVVALLCGWSLIVSTQEWGGPDHRFAISRLIPTLALVVLVAANAVLVRNGSSLFALVTFLVTFVVVGAVVAYFGNGFLKGFAPAPPEEAATAKWVAVAVVSSTIAAGILAFSIALRTIDRRRAGGA